MSKRELIARELEQVPERELDKLLVFVRLLAEGHADTTVLALAAESSLAKDWLSPEEDEAWAGL